MITVNITSTKYEVEKFNGENNFSLWRPAYGYLPSAERSKLDPKSIKCIFLSFEIYGVVTK